MAAPIPVPRVAGGRVLLAALLCLLGALAAPARAADPDFPALAGRVVDAANVIPTDAREAIGAKLRAHEERTSDQVVVATVPSLGDLTIED